MTTTTLIQPEIVSKSKQPARLFLHEVQSATPGDSRLLMCIQCGSCGGSCPSGKDMEHTPREIFAMIRAGLKDEVLSSNTPWFCVSCYYCMVRCPQDIHITDIMYTLKSLAIEEGYAEKEAAPDFSQSFVDYVENFGRSFEFGLATRHFLRHRMGSMSGMASIGMGMFSKGRMDLTPHPIEGVEQLQKILARAKELENGT